MSGTMAWREVGVSGTHAAPTSSILPMQHKMLHLSNAKFLLERAINVVKTQWGFPTCT